MSEVIFLSDKKSRKILAEGTLIKLNSKKFVVIGPWKINFLTTKYVLQNDFLKMYQNSVRIKSDFGALTVTKFRHALTSLVSLLNRNVEFVIFYVTIENNV